MKAAPCLLLCCLGLCLLIPAWSIAGQEGLVVESVSFHRENPPNERIRIKLSGPHTPKAFTMEGDNKPRLIFDFVGARYAGLVTPVVNGSDTLVKNIRIGVHTDPAPKVRVVLDLEPGRNYTYTREFLKQENVLNVNLVPAEPAKKPEPSVARIDAGEAKQKVVGGSKKTVLLTAPAVLKHRPAVASEPAAGTTPGGKPTQAAPVAKAQPPAEQEKKPAERPADTPVAGAVSAEKPEKPGPAEAKQAVKQEAKQVVKQDDKPAAVGEAKAPAAEAAPKPGGEGATAKAPAEPPLKPAGEDAVEAVKKTAEPAEAVAPETAEVPQQDKTKQATAASKPPEQKAAEPTEEPATPDPLLRDVTYENNSSKGEMIFFHLNGFFPPNVSAVESDSPQVICEFLNMAAEAKVKPVIEARGAYVQKIETTAGKDPKKIQVVLTLTPHRDYDLRQVFFKEDNLFVLVVNTMDEESVEEAPDPQD